MRRTQLEPSSERGGRDCAPLPACACQLTPLTALCVRLAAVGCCEIDGRHHRHRGRGGRRLFGGNPLLFSTIYRRSDAPRARMWAAACRCETAWSFLTAAQVAGLVQQGGSCHRAARASFPCGSGGSGGAEKVAYRGQHAACCMRKSWRAPVRVSRVVRGAVGEACVFLTRQTPLYTVVCVVCRGSVVEKLRERSYHTSTRLEARQ